MKKYGDWIKKSVPLPTHRAIPELRNSKEWEIAIKEWDQRIDIKRANKALAIFKEIADKEHNNGLAQLWVCRAMYYLGYYYMAEEQQEKSIKYYKEGAKYGERALKIIPRSVAAHYWFLINFGRSIQNTNPKTSV